jgi:hypothetical protein
VQASHSLEEQARKHTPEDHQQPTVTQTTPWNERTGDASRYRTKTKEDTGMGKKHWRRC